MLTCISAKVGIKFLSVCIVISYDVQAYKSQSVAWIISSMWLKLVHGSCLEFELVHDENDLKIYHHRCLIITIWIVVVLASNCPKTITMAWLESIHSSNIALVNNLMAGTLMIMFTCISPFTWHDKSSNQKGY